MPKRVLIVEDGPTQDRRLQLELARVGLEVELVSAGDGCLDVARSLQPAAIILDVRRLDTDGYHLCRLLKANPETAHIPLVIMTQYDREHDAVGTLQAGVDDYIPRDRFAEFNLLAALRNLGVL